MEVQAEMKAETGGSVRFLSLPGLSPYAEVHRLQLELAERRARDEIPDTILFLEHTPVVTRGRGLQRTDTPRERQVPLAAPLPRGVDYFESERGGDLTYHGPGQLVIYPIVKLDGSGLGPDRDLHAWLRLLEQWVMDDLAEFGLEGRRVQDATGVWVGERKVASLGVALRRWVNYHGIAVNVVNDLQPFSWITPCGFSPEVMTSVKRLIPDAHEDERLGASWRAQMEERWSTRLASSFKRQ